MGEYKLNPGMLYIGLPGDDDFVPLGAIDGEVLVEAYEDHDAIKKGLECCVEHAFCAGRSCPYYKAESEDCDLMTDALAYIQQLEAERDAAVKDIEVDGACEVCKHIEKDAGEPPCNHCFHVNKGTDSYFEWRGVQKEE